MSLYQYYANFDTTKKILDSKQINISKSNQDVNRFLITLDYYNNLDKTFYVVCSSLTEAQYYYEMMVKYIPQEDVLFYPADELITQDMLISSSDFLFERINTLLNLAQKKHKVVITNTNGIIKKILPKEILTSSCLELSKNMVINPNELVSYLVQNGYQKVSQTLGTADFSKRGEILDVFILGYDRPVRIDFFDDEIESIKFFDPITQRSLEEVSKVKIIPVVELIYNDELLEKVTKKLSQDIIDYDVNDFERETLQNSLSDLKLRLNLSRHTRFLDLFYENASNITSYTTNNRIYFTDSARIEDSYLQIIKDYREYRNHSNFKIEFNPMIDLHDILVNVRIEGYRSESSTDISLDVLELEPLYGRQASIIKLIVDCLEHKNVMVCFSDDTKIDEFKSLLFDHDIYYNEGTIENPKNKFKLFFSKEFLPPVYFNDENICILNEDLFYTELNAKKTPKYKSIYKQSSKISRYEDLEVGDYIVHYDYGIGKYLGLKTLECDGVNKDFIEILYADEAKLFVPVDRISSIMKYASKDMPNVTLHSMNQSAWRKTKERIRSKIRDISDRLISIYANRKKSVGYAFPLDDEKELEFENLFPYELTADQKRAIDTIKEDMEKPMVMDRLVCGDVGYGKTEVALRAAYKACMALKQVVLLCPTTILSKQHYETFYNRVKDFGIKVCVINRFVKTKEYKELLSKIESGDIDIIIGTHRLLSSDIKYHDLGLLIIDEEQRFGVMHKEKIKELKANVDCITLSATPIPRTLQMSMLGIKDLSMIETPPKNRYPIQTYVCARKKGIIRDAIEKEIARDGQVFYLYNKVEDIEEQASEIARLVPNAKVCFAHGRMKANDLEDVILKFINKEYNVLVCTTIIETGIDIPETNTLIIHDATKLGLGQMYQIRGRVGRSDRIAYAYMMYDDNKILTENSMKRLEVIKDLNELGSGFKIAMRDLAIRGSGDILGAEQSGFIDTVGIDMYMRILDEEINKKPKEEDKPKLLQTPLVSMSINKNYINNEELRITFHKKIDNINNLDDLNTLKEELLDRFGELDEDTNNYLYEKLFKKLIYKFGFIKVEHYIKKFELTMDEAHSNQIDGRLWFKLLAKYKNLDLTYKTPNIILTRNNTTKKIDAIKEIILYLDEINNELNK